MMKQSKKCTQKLFCSYVLLCMFKKSFYIVLIFLCVCVYRLYGENAIPVPNSSAADRLSYLHKELQEKVRNIKKT